MSFQSTFPEVLNGVDALTDGEMSSGTSLSIEQKCTHQYLGSENMTSETSRFFNPPRNNVLSRARNEPSDLNARNSDKSRLLLQNNYLLACVWEDFASGCTSDYTFLVRKSSNTGKANINYTSLGHEIGNVISMVDNSAMGKNPINPIDNTINNVKGDKDIGVTSRISNPDKGCDE
ncbi:hypothetical protein RDI58_010063 [Solanum bulbocastanum]|uniref:Uncharacterized protein n=1 Tax=Solanum bulbocastanum TaxID=147425 RepID=A0AAN8TTB7_SOLBU